MLGLDSLGTRFFLIAGPCIVEDDKTSFSIAERLKSICDKYDIPLIFKASYKKANRTRLDSFTGIGDKNALEVINNIGKSLSVPVLTDIHESKDAEFAAKYVDALQIPAFLSRQTDLLIAAAKTGKTINIKKAQFASPDVMKSFNCPLVLDCTHSLQLPNQSSGVTGGKPEFINTLASAGIAAGADGIFIETHPNPSISKSDGANMIALDQVELLIEKLVKIKKAL